MTTPNPNPQPARPLGRRWVGRWVVVTLALLAPPLLAVGLLPLLRPPPPTQLQRPRPRGDLPPGSEPPSYYADLIADLEGVAAVVTPSAAWPALDPARELERLRALDPQAVAAAEAAHRPLSVVAGDLHATWEAFLARGAELDPCWAISLGLHPHRAGGATHGVALTAGWFFLARDLHQALERWPPPRDAHARTDLAAARAYVERALRIEPGQVTDGLDLLEDELSALATLSVRDCCPAATRAQVTLERLRGLDRRLPQLRVERASAPELDDALSRIPDQQAFLRDLPRRWPQVAAIGSAAQTLAADLEPWAERLRARLPQAGETLGAGREAYERVLRLDLGLDLDVRQALRSAVQAFREADAEVERLLRSQPPAAATQAPPSPPDARQAYARALHRLRAQVGRWVLHPPPDPGLLVERAPPIWAHDAGAYYVGPGLDGPPDAEPRLLTCWELNSDDLGWSLLQLDHYAAHEGYPGHHLQALLARAGACRLRRVCSSSATTEGWAVYAEDLAHQAGLHADQPRDPLVRASERRHRAWLAALDVLVNARLLPPPRLLALHRIYWGQGQAALAELVDATRYPGLFASYFLGAEALRALRQRVQAREGDAFDARAFHERLLRAGPLPLPLLEAELWPR